jgi:DNA-binding SARP family transcriptional activator
VQLLLHLSATCATIGLESPDSVLLRQAIGEARVSGVRFTVLGTLTMTVGAGNSPAVLGTRQRTLLASLLLSANAPVSSNALAEAVWDGLPPPGAATTLRSHVRRLRVSLGPASRIPR